MVALTRRLKAVRELASSRWGLAGVATGLVLPILVTLSDPCEGGEAVFGITLLGAIVGFVVGSAVPYFKRTKAFFLGASAGFAAAFVLIFFVAARFFPC